MVAYKLFRQLPNGDITSLFIDKKTRIPFGEWLEAGEHPTLGFAFRPGWHCTAEPIAPHLKMELANGEVRAWYRVEIEDYIEVNRPRTQGGLWYLANKMRVIERL